MATTALHKLLALVEVEAFFQMARSAPGPLAIGSSRLLFCGAMAMVRMPAWLRLIA